MSAHPRQCPSCSLLFERAAFSELGECGRCSVEDNNDPQCTSCGATFPKLATSKCGLCLQEAPATVTASEAPPPPPSTQQAPPPPPPTQQVPPPPLPTQDLLDHIAEALRHPPNPRAATNTYAVPDRAQRWEAADASSRRVLGLMNTQYRQMSGIQAKQGGPPPAPVGAQASQAAPSVGNIFVSVKTMMMNARKQKNFTPYSTFLAGETTYPQLLELIRSHVDGECSRLIKPPIRIYSCDEVQLRFSNSGYPPVPETVEGNLWDLFTHHKGMGTLYISKKEADTTKLEMEVWVTHDEPDDHDAIFTRRNTRSKRPLPDDYETQVRTRILPRTSVDEASFDKHSVITVYKTSLEIAKATNGTVDLEEVTTLDAIKVKIFDHTELGRRKTKVVYKMQMEDHQLFAAKKYCSDNNDDEDEDEAQNIEWLQEEMKRAMTANNIAEAFTHDTVQKGISAHAVSFLIPFIIHEEHLLLDGKAWLCDKYLIGKTEKYSGTNEAGNHTEKQFAGLTCDALAHFSLASSSNERVLVDLQGIITKPVRGAPVLHLFDVQSHTAAGNSGLGDEGEEGIERFKNQHVCNRICRELGLGATR